MFTLQVEWVEPFMCTVVIFSVAKMFPAMNLAVYISCNFKKRYRLWFFFLFLQFYILMYSNCILMWKNVLLQKPWELSLTLNPKLFCIKLTESHNIQLYNNNRFVFSHFVLMIHLWQLCSLLCFFFQKLKSNGLYRSKAEVKFNILPHFQAILYIPRWQRASLRAGSTLAGGWFLELQKM